MLDRLRTPTPLGAFARRVRAWRWRVSPRALARAAGFVVVVLAGAWLGLMVGGRESTPVGPVDTHMTAEFSWSGETHVRVGPLGTLTFDTHDGPLGITVDVEQLNVTDARALVENPAALQGLEEWVSEDAREAITRLIVRAAVSAVLGAVLLSVLVYRRRARRIVFIGGAACALVAGTLATAAATWNPRSLSQPAYTGLLVSAPSVVGSARDIMSGFSDYSQSLAKLVSNVSQLYDVTSTLPTYQPDESTIRVLHVADIHLNPAAWDVIKEISELYRIGVIVDSGDISDHGSKAERRFTEPIGDLTIPYVYVRGNHDSQDTVDAIAKHANAVVLDNGVTRDVAGLRITGYGDPRFTPDKSRAGLGNEALTDIGRQWAFTLRYVNGLPADFAVVHDQYLGEPLDGLVPLVLAGHAHQRSTALMEGGTRMFVQGSTGGGGLRALEGEEPEPMEATVLYFDAETKRLQAWDDLTMGGLGLSSAKLERKIAPEETARLEEAAAGARGKKNPDAALDEPVPAGRAARD